MSSGLLGQIITFISKRLLLVQNEDHILSVPPSPMSAEVLMMVYTKGNIDTGIVEFDISTKKYKSVHLHFERTDKYYFIIMAPKNSSISDNAIAKLESSKT